MTVVCFGRSFGPFVDREILIGVVSVGPGWWTSVSEWLLAHTRRIIWLGFM